MLSRSSFLELAVYVFSAIALGSPRVAVAAATSGTGIFLILDGKEPDEPFSRASDLGFSLRVVCRDTFSKASSAVAEPVLRVGSPTGSRSETVRAEADAAAGSG